MRPASPTQTAPRSKGLRLQAMGGVRRAGRPDGLDRRLGTLRLRQVRRLLQTPLPRCPTTASLHDHHPAATKRSTNASSAADSTVRLIKFILDGLSRRPPAVGRPGRGARRPAGFAVTRVQQSAAALRPHLDTWAANLASKKDEAIAITSVEVYERFMKYLAGCADLFRNGYTDVCQLTCERLLLSPITNSAL